MFCFFQSGYYYYGSVDGTNFYASDVNCAGKIIFILIFVENYLLFETIHDFAVWLRTS